MTSVYIQQIAKEVIFSESYKAASLNGVRCERWDINLNEGKSRAICFSHHRRSFETLLTVKVRNMRFVNCIKYLGVTFDKKKYMENAYRSDSYQGLHNIYSYLLHFQKGAIKC
jgi:hypothetical protein